MWVLTPPVARNMVASASSPAACKAAASAPYRLSAVIRRNQGVNASMLRRNRGRSMSLCTPLLRSSINPGFGVSRTSSVSAFAARPARYPAAKSTRISRVRFTMASSPWARLREQTVTGPPQIRQVHCTRRDSLSPSVSSTSRSYSRPTGVAVSSARQAAFSSAAGRSYTSRASQPVAGRMISAAIG